MGYHPGTAFGAAARWMVAQDARWAADAMLSADHRQDWRGVLSLALFGHSARITYEGSIALRSRDPNVGIPVLVDHLPPEQSPLITRARHATKLLDDRAKSLFDLLHEMAGYYGQHHAEFTGNAVRLARWLETDLGLFIAEGRLLGGTIPLQFRFGAPATHKLSDLGTWLWTLRRRCSGWLSLCVRNRVGIS